MSSSRGLYVVMRTITKTKHQRLSHKPRPWQLPVLFAMPAGFSNPRNLYFRTISLFSQCFCFVYGSHKREPNDRCRRLVTAYSAEHIALSGHVSKEKREENGRTRWSLPPPSSLRILCAQHYISPHPMFFPFHLEWGRKDGVNGILPLDEKRWVCIYH